VLFSIGLTQREAIQYTGSSSTLSPVPALWTSYFSTALDAVSAPPVEARHPGTYSETLF
jgi:hypothetical protein